MVVLRIVVGVLLAPGDFLRRDALCQQLARDLAPAAEAAVETGAVHYQSAICAGVSLSCRRRLCDSLSCSGGR